MKTIEKSIIVILVLIGLVACGSNSSIEPNDTPNSDDTKQYTSIKIDRDCINTPDIGVLETYIPLLSGDTIVKDENKTKIEIYHGDNKMRVVCIVNGTAHIVRLIEGVSNAK